MVNHCAVVGCTNRSNRDKDKSFFRIPKVITNQGIETEKFSNDRRMKWLNNIKRKDLNPLGKNWRVCSDHFIGGKPSKLYEVEDPDWAPTVNMGYKRAGQPKKSKERHTRVKRRAEVQQHQAAAKALLMLSDSKSPIPLPESEPLLMDSEGNPPIPSLVSEPRLKFSDASIQTDLTVTMIAQMELELQESNCRLHKMKEEEQGRLIGTKEWLQKKEGKTVFYTGLPNIMVVQTLFTFLMPGLKQSPTAALTMFQEFILTLMRLRLNLSLNDLAHRFDVSRSTASVIFLKWVEIMFIRMGPLIKWPTREQLRETTPMCFRKHFGTNIAIIIDCFEVFIEKPANMLARATTWSQYKHHNTCKFLIGISPQGVITFISKAWGGRVSDKHLTEHSGLLDYLLPGDWILADRGFDISEDAAMYFAKVKIPAFTRGKKQLSALEVEESRRIASVRIHVERVIGNFRNKYKIFKSTLPLDYLMAKDNGFTTIDKIALVCCALTNLCDSVIPFD